MTADTTWHVPAVLVLSLSLSGMGCTSAHDPTDGSVADGSVADGSSSDCRSFSGAAGSPCSFDGTCTVPPSPGDPIRECCHIERSCVDGVSTLSEECADDPRRTTPWGSCGSYLDARGFCTSGGLPGDPCDVATFGECDTGALRGPEMCAVAVTCVGGITVEDCPVISTDACVDEAEPPPGVEICRDDVDCTSSEEHCFRDGDSSCGPCMSPTRLCASDGDCGSSAHCEEYLPTCSCGGTGTQCVPDCSAASDCDADELCQGDGRCVAISCEAGYECPENTRCSSGGGSSTLDAHSCARLDCSTDGDCDCGYCVRGSCVSNIGICMLPAA